MRMCYLSISHTNVFSVTVPPRRLQEGSGALIKGAFAGQECGLLHPGVTGAGCLLGRASAQMASRGLRSVAAEPGCNEAFPLHRCASSEPPAPPLARNTRTRLQHNTAHTPPSHFCLGFAVLSLCSFLLSSSHLPVPNCHLGLGAQRNHTALPSAGPGPELRAKEQN